MFDICLLDHAAFAEPNSELTPGIIQLEDFHEEFETSLIYWNKDQYQNHWIESVKLLVDGAQNACLITSSSDQTNANFFICLAIYRCGSEFRVQNHLLFLDDLDEPFDIVNPSRSMRVREIVSEDGQRISEWSISSESLRNWLSRFDV